MDLLHRNLSGTLYLGSLRGEHKGWVRAGRVVIS